MDRSRINDMKYMKRQLKNTRNVRLLGENLRKNPDFIIQMIKDKDFKNHWALLRVIDESLITPEFITLIVKALLEKGITAYNIRYQLYKIFPSYSFMKKDNKEFWDNMRELGIYEFGDIYNNHDGNIDEKRYAKSHKLVLEKILDRINTITEDEFNHLTSLVDRANPEFMLNAISKNPSLYICLSEKLKTNTDFMQHLISTVPEIEDIIEKYNKKMQDEYNKQEKEKQERKIEVQKQRENAKRLQVIEEQNKIIQEYKEQGEQHPNLILVNDFLKANQSRILFCEKHNIDIEQLNNAIKEVSFVYPEIATKLTLKNKQVTAIHLNIIEDINSKLLSGKMTLEKYSRKNYKGKRIDTLLSYITDMNERKHFHELIVKTIASGKLTMMDYMRLFSEEYDYKTIINSINKYMKIVSKESPELQEKDKLFNIANMEIKSLKKYSKPYQSKDFVGSSRGFVNSEGKTVIVPITEEYITYARKYLQLEDEYICYATMNSALSKLVKGEVTFEEIDEKTTKKISMKSVVANAINKGITTEQVEHSNLVEQSKVKENSIEGETIDD